MRPTKLIHSMIMLFSLAAILPGCSENDKEPSASDIPDSAKSKTGFAAVAIAAAALEIADDLPDLPDSPHQSALTTAVDLSETGPRRVSEETPGPMRFEFRRAPVLSEPLPAQLVVGHWPHGCPAGERQERDLRRTLTPLGWIIGNGSTDQIQLIHISQNEPCPQITLYQNGTVIKSWTGYQDPTFLSHELRRAWDSAPSSQVNAVTTGSGGAIHARTQIHSALEWWKHSIGEGTKLTIRWNRSGAQTFPLLAQGDWSATAIFGRTGRLEVEATSGNLPVTSLGLTYRILGDDVSIDLDPLHLTGIAARLGANSNSEPQVASPLVSAFGPVTAWTIVSLARDLVSLLHPSCDLKLAGDITASAEMLGEILVIEFSQPPSVRFVALFTFQLSVNRIEISAQSVRLLFSGSRLVKERTFLVK